MCVCVFVCHTNYLLHELLINYYTYFQFIGDPPIISTQPPDPSTDRPPTLPPNMLINIGQNVCITTDQMVDISCTTESGTEPINFIWTRDPDPGVISNMSVLQDVGVGTYNCEATNSFGSDVESSSIFS